MNKNDYEPSERVMVQEAIDKAIEAFNNHLFNEYNVDSSYYRIKLEVSLLDTSFTEVLEKITYEGRW